MAAARHQYRIYIKSPIGQVWNALIEAEFTRRYFFATAYDAPPMQGSGYRTSMPDGSAGVDGVIETLEPPHRMIMTWHVLYDAGMAEEPPSRVEWLLSEAGEGLTQLDVTHGDLARSPLTWASVQHGWTWVLNGLKTLLETGEALPAVTSASIDEAADASGEWHRAQGIECNNGVWELIERVDRTAADNEQMLRRAYASAYHWQRAVRRGPENEARAVWMLSKVHLLRGDAAFALAYAQMCMDQCHEFGLVDFDLAYAFEVTARALKALGRDDEAAAAWQQALDVPIADPEDKAIVDADLAVGP